MSNYKKVNQRMEDAVVSGYRALENGAAAGHKTIEAGVVSGFQKIEDRFVATFLTEEGETVDAAKARLRKRMESKGAAENGGTEK